jgi:hypothetical protein
MAGPRDLKLRPGDRIRFGSLEFLVGAQSEAHGATLRLTLVNDAGDSVMTVEARIPGSNKAAATAPNTHASVSPPPKPLSEKERERITRRLDGLLGPLPSLHEKQDPRSSLVDVIIQVSGKGLLDPKEQASTEEPLFPWGLHNAARAFTHEIRRRLGRSLTNSHGVLRAHGCGEFLRSSAPPNGCRRGFSSTVNFDTELIPPPTKARYPPWRECFVVLQPAGAGDYPAHRLVNGAGNLLSPEEVAERLCVAEERHRAIDREIEELGGITPGQANDNEGGQQIQTDEFGFPLFRRARQIVAAAALLVDQLPPPETPEFRRVHDDLKNFLKRAAVQQAESSAKRCGQYYEDGADSCSQYTMAKGAGDAATMAQREPAPVPPTPATCNVAPVHNWFGNNRDARKNIEARRRDHSDSSDEERRASRGRTRRDDDRRDNRERSPTPDPHDVGPRAFSYQIWTARIPPRFRLPTNITKYDGETDPAVWLEDFRISCRAGGADTDVLIIRNLPLYLGDPARHWLEHLPKGRIRS